jgi:hypothetical protein
MYARKYLFYGTEEGKIDIFRLGKGVMWQKYHVTF